MAVYHRGNRVDCIKTHDIKPTQEKTIQATTETQYVLPDVGYELSQVTVLGYKDNPLWFYSAVDIMQNGKPTISNISAYDTTIRNIIYIQTGLGEINE